jgi:hypothetical protein
MVHRSLKPAYIDLEPECDHDDDPSNIGLHAIEARAEEHAGHIIACARTKISVLLKSPALRAPLTRFIERTLMHNQMVRSCCRDAESHEIEAWYSSAEDASKGVPDIYVVICGCGRWHRYFCVGGTECPPMEHETADEHAARLASSKRPFWEVR